MRLLAKLLFFRKDFLTESVTAWGGTVYFPSAAWCRTHPDLAWQGLAHALVHVSDYHRVTPPVYALSYLFPQCLAPLAVGAFWHSWMGLFLLALLPWPAPFRKHWEVRATAMTMATEVWQGRPLSEPPEEALHRLAGPRYYWCWPYRDALRRELHRWLVSIKARKLGLFIAHTTDVKFAIRIESVLR